jgi:hypothetical protein
MKLQLHTYTLKRPFLFVAIVGGAMVKRLVAASEEEAVVAPSQFSNWVLRKLFSPSLFPISVAELTRRPFQIQGGWTAKMLIQDRIGRRWAMQLGIWRASLFP